MAWRSATAAALAAAALAAAALAASGACTASKDAPEPVDEEARLVDLINEGHRLESELAAAEVRVLDRCLEEQGHTVHDGYLMQVGEPEEIESLTRSYPYEEFLPDAGEAEETAFGKWSRIEQNWAAEDAGEYVPIPEDFSNPEFSALPPETRYDWYVAYFGADIAERDYAWLLDPDADPDELGTGADDGATELGDGSTEEPLPGGCRLEMVEALYGEARTVVDEEESEAVHVTWEWRPAHPETEEGWNALNADYRSRIHEEEGAFLDCLAERGLGEWRFDEFGRLPVDDYFSQVYGSELTGGFQGAGAQSDHLPEPPDGVAGDYEEAKAHEFETAAGFAECGDRSGYREAARTAWDEALLEYYLAMEAELYGWQEAMNDAIARAQRYLDS